MRYFCYQKKFLQKALKKKKELSRGIYEDIESVIIVIGLDCLTYWLLDLPGKDNCWILCRKTIEVQ